MDINSAKKIEVPSCGICGNPAMDGITIVGVQEKDDEDLEFFEFPVCDAHRREICVCETCAAYNSKIYEDDEDEDEDDEVQMDEWCQLTHDANDTEGDDWCLEWRQAWPFTIEDLEHRVNSEGKEEEEDGVEEDEDED